MRRLWLALGFMLCFVPAAFAYNTTADIGRTHKVSDGMAIADVDTGAAAQVDEGAVHTKGVPIGTSIMNTKFNATTTETNSTSFSAGEYQKLAFFVTYDETQVNQTLSAAVTLDLSYDNATWLDASFYDYAGGATLQTSETVSADGSYYCWFNKDVAAPYVRVNVVATNSDPDDIINVTVNAYGLK
jgi:hypothetical protein